MRNKLTLINLIELTGLGGKLRNRAIQEPKPQAPEKTRLERYHGTFEQHKQSLAKDNQMGQGIYFTVNQTDGKGRKEKNITRVRALFIDLDGSPIEPVYSAPLSPHIIVETSPQRYHAYWIVENVPIDPLIKPPPTL